ncbi:MAG TPA: DUF488 domain-containing protein [Streptosporangiaceae bacterium]|nr:DUF488 domain-containing protein [Streptosporangiaceae bacterium]
MTDKTQVNVRRVYEKPEPGDGCRVLVDRLWPRGVSKEEENWDEWLKDVAPSTELRRWYGHDPAKFTEFRRRYAEELGEPGHSAAFTHLRDLAQSGPLTLLTSTRDAAHSEADVLAELLNEGAAPGA